MAVSIPILANLCYLLCFCILFFSFYSHKSCVYGARELASHQHPNKNMSLMTASPCSTSTTGLQMDHTYEPCSPLGHENPSPISREILLQYQSRVRSLNSIPSNLLGIKLPVLKSHLSDGNFVVKVGFGTPKRDLTLVFDTGSSYTWIQCQPCHHCYDQEEPIFDPSTSSTFSALTCLSSTCPYSVDYHDNSHSNGYYARDTLTFSSTNDFPGFVFGCGLNNSGKFGKVAGILGIGLGDDSSLMYQTSNFFALMFCYCLPSTQTSKGYLILGVQAFLTCQPEITIPLVTELKGSKHYFVKLVAISIGHKRLEMSSGFDSDSLPRTTIDTGTTISRLPPSVYSELRTSFKEIMSGYPRAPRVGLMDTCYNLEAFDTYDVTVPSMILHFDDYSDLNLDPSAVVWRENDSDSQVCLAFAGNPSPDDLTIIGNHQQKNISISYNVYESQVGFNKNGCSD